MWPPKHLRMTPIEVQQLWAGPGRKNIIDLVESLPKPSIDDRKDLNLLVRLMVFYVDVS